jgi:hypothetical protein
LVECLSKEIRGLRDSLSGMAYKNLTSPNFEEWRCEEDALIFKSNGFI